MWIVSFCMIVVDIVLIFFFIFFFCYRNSLLYDSVITMNTSENDGSEITVPSPHLDDIILEAILCPLKEFIFHLYWYGKPIKLIVRNYIISYLRESPAALDC